MAQEAGGAHNWWTISLSGIAMWDLEEGERI